MSDLHPERETLKQQYACPNNLTARSHLHKHFSTNPYGWFRWCLDHISLEEGMQVLELGCGAGWLWQNQLKRLPQRMKIILSDYSSGMVQQARGNIQNESFHFTRCDAQTIPFSANT